MERQHSCIKTGVKKKQEDFDPNQMYEQGCAFLDCAEYTEREDSKIVNRTNSHIYADISLSALACEIFIKCLIIKNNGTYNKKHQLDDLWKLYKELNSDKALEIENSITDWFQSTNPSLFDDMIKEAALAFKEWRYAFEYENNKLCVRIQFLRGFSHDLKILCEQTIHAED